MILLSVNDQNEETSPSVFIRWKGGKLDEYPAVWLRDNCQCPKCYNKNANARLLLMKDLDVNVKPSQVTINTNNVSMHKILW